MKETRLPAVDLLRTLSIVLVVALHISNFAPIGEARSYGFKHAWRLLAYNGHFGVSVFFVVSGYLITRRSVGDAVDLPSISVRDFYVRRVGRILPMLVLTVIVGALMLTLRPDSEALRIMFRGRPPLDLVFWTSLVTFSFNWLRVVTNDEFGLHFGVLWSLSIEEQFYLLFPWVVRWARSRDRLFKVLLVVALQGPLARLAFSQRQAWQFATFMNSFGAFEMIAMGALLALSAGKLDAVFEKNRWLSRFCAAYGAVVFFITYVSVPTGIDSVIYAPTILGLASVCFLAGAMHLPVFRSTLWRIPTMPGQLSYGMYLSHSFVFYWMWPIFPYMDGVTALILSGLATLALSYVLFRVYEKPANDLIRARLGARRVPVATVG